VGQPMAVAVGHHSPQRAPMLIVVVVASAVVAVVLVETALTGDVVTVAGAGDVVVVVAGAAIGLAASSASVGWSFKTQPSVPMRSRSGTMGRMRKVCRLSAHLSSQAHSPSGDRANNAVGNQPTIRLILACPLVSIRPEVAVNDKEFLAA
jgi:hypothetical protein